MKKILLIITIISMLITIGGCKSNEITALYYHGVNSNWEIDMKFNEDNKYIASIKYKGEEKLPIQVNFDIEYLSGNNNEGSFYYTEVERVRGEVTLEEDYNINLHGDISKNKNKENLKVNLTWNNQEEVIELNRIEK